METCLLSITISLPRCRLQNEKRAWLGLVYAHAVLTLLSITKIIYICTVLVKRNQLGITNFEVHRY